MARVLSLYYSATPDTAAFPTNTVPTSVIHHHTVFSTKTATIEIPSLLFITTTSLTALANTPE